ncbi:potassium channel subfamily K member 13-like [Ptychodera flava]|uniref:potassium channel subfamily K member 13-like n=1 Tax=Ptychodera flava TaxID=63121 RepID=UPI00396A278D
MARNNGGWCNIIHLREDNARFVLLMIFILIYLLIGASIFSAIEHEQEKKDKIDYEEQKQAFLSKWNRTMNVTEFTEFQEDFENFLSLHAETAAKGLLRNKKRDRWDFSGSFYFVCTVVSTIGFGMTSPSTDLGKCVLICYGLIGSGATILYFNIFLERLITFLAFVMRSWHMRQLKKKQGANGGAGKTDRRGSQGSEDNLDNWKPSVYYVMVILTISAVVIACCASAMYSSVEDWRYLDAIYFCFVAFSTIGFGDYVPSQEPAYPLQPLYRIGNFLSLLLGVLCIYSMFNVLSIIIKQFLNWCIKKLDCRCCVRRKPRPRRNAITPGHLQQRQRQPGGAPKKDKNVEVTDVDSTYDSDTDGRRMSGEMISMKDFLAANKVSLAVMQKQLYETSQNRGMGHHHRNGGLSQGVGALAMLDNKLQETEK